MELKTIYISNIPMDCHIMKGRLDSEGLDCFIYDENFIWVYPFYAVAIGGVKLKVPSDQVEPAEYIFNLIKQAKLKDEKGEYDINSVLENEIIRQDEILMVKSRIRSNPSLLETPVDFKIVWLDENDIKEIIDSEKKFLEFSKVKLDFRWEQFWYELLDFDRDFFKYLRTRPVEYYLDKELVDNYNSRNDDRPSQRCHKCNSDNVCYGYAIDYKWDVPFLFLSFLFFGPFPLLRKNYHCFDCGASYL
jgi:hypothetical protein